MIIMVLLINGLIIGPFLMEAYEFGFTKPSKIPSFCKYIASDRLGRKICKIFGNFVGKVIAVLLITELWFIGIPLIHINAIMIAREFKKEEP